ncbi:unnamed protein product [Mytilus edulis]|uniref:Uncharacterized protein n=1 Tax=Mytilus edulis TaxID=6550 RepID=A0A8S3PP58_MYTED|nr:unnamed protein product [Mytilus edulis]
MAAENVQFTQSVTSTGKTEYKTQFGRGKVLSFKKSARGLFYLDLATSNGAVKLNLGLDELDDLFTLRGTPRVPNGILSTAALPATGAGYSERKCSAGLYTTTTFRKYTFINAPLTLIYGNEATPLQTDPMWNKGSTIPVRVATKRQEESLPQWVSKTAKYEQVSPVKNNLYNLSEEEMGAFFQAM